MAIKTPIKIFDEYGILYDTHATFGRRGFRLDQVVSDRRSLKVDPVEDTTARVVRGLLREGVVRDVGEGGPFVVLGTGGAVLGDELGGIELRVLGSSEDEGALNCRVEVTIPDSALERAVPKHGHASGASAAIAARLRRSGEVDKARAAMAAAAAELAAKNPHWRDPARKVRVAVGSLSMRPQGLRPATMGDADVLEALARHGLAEATGRGLAVRAGHLLGAAATTLSEKDVADAREELDDYPRY